MMSPLVGGAGGRPPSCRGSGGVPRKNRFLSFSTLADGGHERKKEVIGVTPNPGRVTPAPLIERFCGTAPGRELPQAARPHK